MVTKVSVELSLVSGHRDVLRVEGVTVSTLSVAQQVEARRPVVGVQRAGQVVQRISHSEHRQSQVRVGDNLITALSYLTELLQLNERLQSPH